MATSVDWGSIETRRIYPEGDYEAVLESWKEGRSSQKGYYQIVGRFLLLAPATYAGKPFTQFWTLGMESDPDGEHPDTQKLSVGFARLKEALVAMRAPLESTLEGTLDSAVGQKLILKIGLREYDKRDGTGSKTFNDLSGVAPLLARMEEAPPAPALKTKPAKGGNAGVVKPSTPAKREQPCPRCEELVPLAMLADHLDSCGQE